MKAPITTRLPAPAERQRRWDVGRCAALLGLLGSTMAAPLSAQPDAAARDAAASTLHMLDGTDEPGVRGLLAEQRDALGRRCEVRAVAASGALRFVACGAAGLWIYRTAQDGTAQLLAQRLFDGAVSGLFLRDAQLWIEISSLRAQPVFAPSELAAGPPAAAPAPTPAAPPPLAASAPPTFYPPLLQREAARSSWPAEAPPARGRVVALEAGHAIVDLGRDLLVNGDHVALYRLHRENIDGNAGGEERELLAVGEVVAIAGRRSRVQLGVGEFASIGDLAERSTERLSRNNFAPPRIAGLWDFGVLLRGFLVLDNLGVGGVLDGRAGYRMQAPFHFEALLSPLAIASARGGATVPVAGILTASFDVRLFEIGLGVGGQTVNQPDLSLDPGSGTTVAQRLRLGARDGAHVEAFSYAVLFHSEFSFSFVRVQAQIPLGGRTWLLAAGGGGTLGLGFGELGLRVLTYGNGGPGSFFLTTVIGGANVFRGCEVVNNSCSTLDYVGPMFGMGGEWRP